MLEYNFLEYGGFTRADTDCKVVSFRERSLLTPNRSGWQIGSWSYNYCQVTMSSVEHLYDVYLQPEQGSTWGACRAKGDAGREEISPVCPSVLAQKVDHKESSLQSSLSGVCAHPLEVGRLIFTVQLERLLDIPATPDSTFSVYSEVYFGLVGTTMKCWSYHFVVLLDALILKTKHFSTLIPKLPFLLGIAMNV